MWAAITVRCDDDGEDKNAGTLTAKRLEASRSSITP
jgi:hypothetical protein